MERFHSLIDQEATLPPEYEDLIERQEKRPDQGTRFKDTIYSDKWPSILWQESAIKTREFFAERLTGKPLVDLGGGRGWMTGFANELRVGEYVNVDRNHNQALPSDPYRIINSSPLGTNIQADMLDFAARLKDGVANFTINGVNQEAIDDERYHAALAKEILRATQSGGLIFGIKSRVITEISKIMDSGNSPVREVNLKKETGYCFRTPYIQSVFEKTK
ncbi:hypothetical protein C0416_04785 [bacterium]|nr:hypothetical protein [bacterium]